MSTTNNNNNILSDSDDSAVVVEHTDAAAAATSGGGGGGGDVPALTDEDKQDAKEATAYQIVSIGTEEDAYAFHFDEAKLDEILKQIPIGWQVAVLSVVGAFRTGKSFLLSWFLRYLNHLSQQENETHGPVRIDIDDDDDNKTATKQQQEPWYKEYQSLGNNGFEWKAGSDRNTTGIWMWSRPFFLKKSTSSGADNEQPMALLLIDTQGMFDHETTMSLTASIFGFSTLLSSFQIYNVDKRIQEDNLQQLALFSEYARMAVTKEHQQEQADTTTSTTEAPFQRMEFLVRDWQHFDDDDDDDQEAQTLDAMEASMTDYLATVLQEREAADLKDTRSQIMTCFDELTCYGLCHPGFAVTKKKFTGDVNAMEDLFVKLLDRYCQRVFQTVQPKKVHGRTLTAVELGSYIRAYAKLFATGAHFPTAVTLLEATASANNTNAIQMGFMEYQDRMDRVAGPRCSNYIRPEELEQEHYQAVQAGLRTFGDIATFGNPTSIDKAKRTLQDKIHNSHAVYESLNDGRNPLKGMEMYLISFFVLLTSYVVRTFLDFTCAPHATLCKVGSELASHAYAVVLCFLAILVATRYKQVKDHFGRLQRAWNVVMDTPATTTQPSSSSSNKAKAE